MRIGCTIFYEPASSSDNLEWVALAKYKRFSELAMASGLPVQPMGMMLHLVGTAGLPGFSIRKLNIEATAGHCCPLVNSRSKVTPAVSSATAGAEHPP